MNAIQTNIQGGKIFQAIPAIIAEVSPVGKNAYNQQQKYPYRSADDVCDAVHESLGKHKVFTTCKIVERSVVERESRGGGLLLYVTLKAIYTFHAEDGSHVESEAFGEAMDSGDKATNKAMTAAYKYALIQVFCLMGHEDSEVDSPEPAPQQQQSYPPRKQLPACPSCHKADHVIAGKAEYGAGLLCFRAKGGCGNAWETAEHPFNENHKAKKSNGNGKAKSEPELPHGVESGVADLPPFESALANLRTCTNGGTRATWRGKVLTSIKAKRFTPQESADLCIEAVKVVPNNSAELDLVREWLTKVAEIGGDAMVDSAAAELTEKREAAQSVLD